MRNRLFSPVPFRQGDQGVVNGAASGPLEIGQADSFAVELIGRARHDLGSRGVGCDAEPEIGRDALPRGNGAPHDTEQVLVRRGSGGNDGNDKMMGGRGNDRMYGENGTDLLIGDGGNDMLVGGDGDDFLSGEAGDDFLVGDLGQDYCIGGPGNDVLTGGLSTGTDDGESDFLRGDEGTDRFFVTGLYLPYYAIGDRINDLQSGEMVFKDGWGYLDFWEGYGQ